MLEKIYLKLRVKAHLDEFPGDGETCPICGDDTWGNMVHAVYCTSMDDGESWQEAGSKAIACRSCAGDEIIRDGDNLDGLVD